MKTFNTLMLLFLVVTAMAKTDKYRLIIRNNPATSATIGWNQISGNEAILYYGTTDQGTNYSAYERWARVSRSASLMGMENKFVRLNNLQPNTAYYFVLKDDEGTSERFWFKTAPADKSRLSFVAGGDSRNFRIGRQNANRLVSKLKPHAVLFGGDMTENDTAYEWKNWMDDWQLTIASDGRMIPLIAARGNHEDSNQSIYDLFDAPSEKIYYGITFGDDLYRVYTLNSFESVGGNQKDWLAEDLKNNDHVIWKSAQYHKPMRPHTATKREYPSEYNAWAHLFYNHGVRLVIESDSHMVKTTYPVKPSTGFNDNEGFIRDDKQGTVYTGEGCWGAPLRVNNDDKQWTQGSGFFNQFKLIFVDENKMELRTIKTGNSLQVAENSNDDIFSLPKNLNVWEMNDPDKTSVVIINRYKAVEVEFSRAMPNIFNTSQIDISLDFKSNADEAKEVTYSVRNHQTGAITTLGTSSQVTNTYQANVMAEGHFTLMASIKRKDNEIITIQKEIFVGDFSLEESNPLYTGSNDVSEAPNGRVTLDRDNLHLGYRFPTGFESIGLRFENLEIPKNAIIDFAYILFTPNRDNNTLAEGLIQIEDTSNSQPYTGTTAEVKNRTKATEEVLWQIPAWKRDEVSEASQTPNLKKLLQSIINKDEWINGNAISFSIQPKNATENAIGANRVAYAYENDPTKAPKLLYGYSYKSSDWAQIAKVSTGIGINTNNPQTQFDINGLMRSSVRNDNGQLFECNATIEGSIGYDNIEKNIKVCTEDNGVFIWQIINLK